MGGEKKQYTDLHVGENKAPYLVMIVNSNCLFCDLGYRKHDYQSRLW